MAESLAARAARSFQVGPLGIAPGLLGYIATNEKFNPLEIDLARGLDPAKYPPELPIASEALTRGMVEEVAKTAPVLSIQDWIERESKKRGGGNVSRGRGLLAAALLGIPAAGRTKAPGYIGMIRALQRSSKATKAGRKEEHKGLGEHYQQLVANLPGGELGNPYAPADVRGRAALRASRVQIQILGDWYISEDFQPGVWKGTDLKPASEFERIWSNPPSLMDEVLAYMGANYRAGDGTAWSALGVVPILDRSYGLNMAIMTPKEASNG